MNSQKNNKVLALSASNRVGYFIRKIADFEELWGLDDSGWALMSESSPDIQRALPIWPEKAKKKGQEKGAKGDRLLYEEDLNAACSTRIG